MPGIDLHTHLAPFPDEQMGPPDLRRPDRLVEYLDTVGLAEAVVSVPPPFYGRDARAVNDGLLAVVAGFDRLTPLAYLPLDQPEAAVAEYVRVRGDSRWAGITAAAGGRSVSLADTRLVPLWEAMDRDARMVFLHPGSSPDSRLEPFYLNNLLGNPAETTLAAAQLVFGDVLARFPSIRFVLAHCGGLVSAVVGRWERGVDTGRPGVPSLTESPRVAVRRFHVDCLAHDPAVVDLAATVFGEDKIVLGSDWPFPMGCADPTSLVPHPDLAHVAALRALGRYSTPPSGSSGSVW